jgi:hypothetical protein
VTRPSTGTGGGAIVVRRPAGVRPLPRRITIDVPPTSRANELADLHGHRGFERQVLALLRDVEPVRAA